MRSSRGRGPCMVFGWLFFVVSLSCAFLAREGNIIWSGRVIAAVLGIGTAAGLVFGEVVYRGLGLWLHKSRSGERGATSSTGSGTGSVSYSRREAVVFWLLILLAWLPGFLAYYPGICAYDTVIQLEQVIKGTYIDHHPIWHTLMMGYMVEWGRAYLGNANTGMALYVLLQMLALSGSFAWGIRTLGESGVSRGIRVGILLFVMFNPLNWYMSISTTKDVFFSACLMLVCFSVWKLLGGDDSFRPGRTDGIFLISSLGVVLFRGNGRYAFAVMALAFLAGVLLSRKKRRLMGRLFTESILGLGLGILFLEGVFVWMGAEQGDRREMLSMPIQQFSRTMVYHGGLGMVEEDDGTMGEEEKAYVNTFILNEGYRSYLPYLADPVKQNTNTYAARYNAGGFVRTYLKLLRSYPGDYINAALAVNAGYLYVGDVTASHIYGEVDGLGYIQTRWCEEPLNGMGIYKDSRLPLLREWLEAFAVGNGYLQLPILRFLLAPGIYFWLYLLLAIGIYMKKNHQMLIPLSLAGGYYGTLFLGPTVQMRYVYPLMVAWPFLLLLFLKRDERDCTGKETEKHVG